MRHRHRPAGLLILATSLFLSVFAYTLLSATPARVRAAGPQATSQDDVDRKSKGCLTCHTGIEHPSMHDPDVKAGCEDCHGGKASVLRDAAIATGSRDYDRLKEDAHAVRPRLDIWKATANPAGVWYRTNEERAEYIRFVNPGDLRVAEQTCGTSQCHPKDTLAVQKSMMRHGGMLWGAALYNNGSYPLKTTPFGEFYMPDGRPAIGYSVPPPSQESIDRDGVLPSLRPLFPFQVTQPGNLLRVFERGGDKPLEPGNPDPNEPPGRPRTHFSDRGLGTLNRTDPVFIGLQKTRLLDPTLNFIGSNDAAGDYRSSGCTACHVIYANDRSPVHSGQYASAGNRGYSQTADPTIPKNESGHPISHVMTKAIPTSQCLVCHIHPGTNMVSTYAGLTWWDNETDGAQMYPSHDKRVSDAARVAIETRNPEGSAVRGLWSDPEFLERTGSAEFNSRLTQTQFADFHGHGWLFRAVFKRDRQGRLIDAQNRPVANASTTALAEAVAYADTRSSDDRPASSDARAAERAGQPVHLKDIHLERGMHCVDCHFTRDSHGNGLIYGEPRNTIEITCVDCHGTTTDRATLKTSGPGAPRGDGTDMTALKTQGGDAQFVTRGDRRIQRSMDGKMTWDIPQVLDSITPGNPRYNERSRLAKTIQKDGRKWGNGASPDLAHANERMTCQTCHSSWMTSCFGCHLSQTANQKRESLHNEASTTRNWTSYNFQVLRDDVFMLGKDGSVLNGRISPVRSSSAVVVSSQDLNRQNVYSQQQTVSSEGFAGQAFNTHVPHTVRSLETKTCTDCHVAAAGDNNAVMAQLMLLGTNFVNFMGRFVYVATGSGGIEAVAVTESSEPQAVIGSDLHRLAYPDEYAAHERRRRELKTAVGHGSTNALSVQARGEYLYIADGAGGFRVFDIAQINQKGFSQKIVTAPVSSKGQNTTVMTRYATAVAAPSTLAVDPARSRRPENLEEPIHPVYGYIYITDREEGLVISTAATLLDGNPSNNFLTRAATFNPDGRLRGATNLAIAGHYAYVLCDRGLVIVNLDRPLAPSIAAEVPAPGIVQATAIAIQFRYAFVTDREGLKVVDVTVPERARLIPSATLPMRDARNVYVARTYAYVAGGPQGLAIVDVEHPERPRLAQWFTAGGALNDVNDVKVAMTNASVFAYLADGRNGLRVVQLISANSTAGAFGFSPAPQPALIATYRTSHPALAISKGLDRDRAVDESGHQVAVFGRKGGRPFNLAEMRRLFFRDGQLWTVTDQPPGPPVAANPIARLMDDVLRLMAGPSRRER